MTTAQQLRDQVAILIEHGRNRGQVAEELGVDRRTLERYMGQAAADDGEPVSDASRRQPPATVLKLVTRLVGDLQLGSRAR